MNRAADRPSPLANIIRRFLAKWSFWEGKAAAYHKHPPHGYDHRIDSYQPKDVKQFHAEIRWILRNQYERHKKAAFVSGRFLQPWPRLLCDQMGVERQPGLQPDYAFSIENFH